MIYFSGALFIFSSFFLIFCYFLRRFVYCVGPDKPNTVVTDDDASSSVNDQTSIPTSSALTNLTSQQLQTMIANAVATALASSQTVSVSPLAESSVDSATSSNSAQTGQISHVSFKPPQPLFNQNPIIWFAILENQFTLSNIVSEKNRFSHAIAALDARLHDSFAHMITRDIGPFPYTVFKNEVIRVLGSSEKSKLHNLMHGLTLGDWKPSQLLVRIKTDAGDTFSEVAIKQLWIHKLPRQMQISLAPFEQDYTLPDLAQKADAIYETMN